MAESSVKVVGLNPDTGLPEPIELPRGSLRDALISNPDVIIDALRDVVGSRRPGGVLPAGTRVQLRPMSTPITDMIEPNRVERLSPGARKLTKADLMALGGWGERKTAAELGLDVKDIQTIRDVFSDRLRPGGVAGGGLGGGFNPAAVDVSCCCCTPCCCAAAEMTPLRGVC